MENDFLLIFFYWPFYLLWVTNLGMVGYVCDCTETGLAFKDKVGIVLLSIMNLDSELKLTWMSFWAKILLLITSDKFRNKFHITNSNWVAHIIGIIVHSLHTNYKSVTPLGRLSTNFCILENSPQPFHSYMMYRWYFLKHLKVSYDHF